MIDSMARTVLQNITIRDILEAINRKYGNKTALRIKTEDGSFRSISYVKLGRRVVGISSVLINLGIAKGDRVAIFSENRPEWAAAFFGIISAGGVVLPVDPKLSDNEVRFILHDSRAKCVFTSAKYIDTIERIRSNLPDLEKIILFDRSHHKDAIFLGRLRPHRGKERERIVYPDDTAVMVYTSGTTGVAKGVELSYKSLLFQVVALSGIIHYTQKDRFLSLLPLNHMLEITGGLIAPLYAGACVTYCDTLKTNAILPLMKEIRITAMISVPLVLKMIHAGIMKRTAKLPLLRRRIFDTLLSVSRFLVKFDIRIGRALFPSVHREFGGRLRGFVSGGAPLDVEVEMDLSAMGFWILQGYGLTETAPVISVNTLKNYEFGSVGRPLPGVEVKIFKNKSADTEGEILTRGPHVMKGYFGDREKTGETIVHGWLHTGDLGFLDKRGFLHISGRKKNMIVLGGGKKVFPEEVEAVMSKSPYIKEICVLARTAGRGLRKGHEEVYAAIVPNLELFEREKMISENGIKEKISSEIALLSEELAAHKRIMSFDIFYEDFPKTASRKIRRDVVATMVRGG
jgi:long-chain acyl-CoA synthetase